MMLNLSALTWANAKVLSIPYWECVIFVQIVVQRRIRASTAVFDRTDAVRANGAALLCP